MLVHDPARARSGGAPVGPAWQRRCAFCEGVGGAGAARGGVFPAAARYWTFNVAQCRIQPAACYATPTPSTPAPPSQQQHPTRLPLLPLLHNTRRAPAVSHQPTCSAQSLCGRSGTPPCPSLSPPPGSPPQPPPHIDLQWGMAGQVAVQHPCQALTTPSRGSSPAGAAANWAPNGSCVSPCLYHYQPDIKQQLRP